MATKDYYLPHSNKKQTFNGNSDFDQRDRYSSLNLNQNNKRLFVDSVSSNSIQNCNKKKDYDFFDHKNKSQPKIGNDFLTKFDKHSFNSSQLESLNLSDFEEKEASKRWKNDSNSSANSSTLSLHIAAYENAVETHNFDDADLKKKPSDKNWKNRKQIFDNSTNEHSIEIPRQQDNKDTEPEIMQFRASQHLLNTNDPNTFSRSDANESTFSRSSEKSLKRFFGSRNDLNSSDRDSFLKAQLTASQKILNDQDVPLKQKHARVLIVGTHKERSAQVFWNTVSNTALEKHPIVTWKFCHLLHKLIRDGHRNVTTDSYKFKNRLVQLGNFWQHLRTSGYGGANFSYCNALVKRLEFHNKYEKFPGSFELPVTNISVSSQNVEKAYELAIDLLDQLEALLDVHSKIAAIMTGLHLSSLTLSGQCTYGPSVQIILDTSKIYDITCHLLFNLHSQLPSDVLDGHRTRFYKIFRQLKTVYWEAKGTNFITGQITVPKLPENSPDFLNASCMDNYHAPEANEKQQMEDDSMISAKSMIVDFSEAPTPSHPIPISLENDTKDSQIRQLQYDNSVLRQRQDTIIEEAQSRVRDYENSLQSLHAELTRTKAFAACAPRYEEEVRKLKQQLNEAQYNQRAAEEKAIKKVSSEMDSRLMIANIDIVNFKRKLENTENALLNLKRENTSFSTICISILKLLEEAGDDLHNATSITYPSHLIANALIADMELLNKLTGIIKEKKVSNELCEYLPLFGHRIANTIVNAAAAAYTASIEKYDGVNDVCKQLLQATVTLMKDFQLNNFERIVSTSLPEVHEKLEKLSETIKKLPTLSGDVDAEQVGAELESEMDRVNKAIADAVAMIEALQKRSRENATGVRMEVNDKILDSCNDLISAIRILVARSRDVQEEIVHQGRGTASPREFYKRNHQWTEGLLSAAKAVGGAATYLVQCADGVVTNNGKFENLIIAAQEVAASVAQLYVSSRVKADRDSKKMGELGVASKTVNKCTATVVATVKSGQLDLADTALDFTNLSLHEAKKLEMESQVRTLELEAELERERIRLAALRKKHYHLASLVSQENGSS